MGKRTLFVCSVDGKPECVSRLGKESKVVSGKRSTTQGSVNKGAPSAQLLVFWHSLCLDWKHNKVSRCLQIQAGRREMF